MSEEIQRLELSSPESEMSVLSVLLSDKSAAAEIVNRLSVEAFTKIGHRLVFAAAQEVFKMGTEVDMVTVQARLSDSQKLETVGGAARLIEISNFAPNPESWEDYAGIVEDKHKLRLLETTSSAILRIVHNPDIKTADEKIEAAYTEVSAIDTRKSEDEQERISVVVKDIFDDVDRAMEYDEDLMPGIPTGFAALDKKTGGYRKGSVYLIGARPAMGKTALAINSAVKVAKQTKECGQKYVVCVITLEVPRKEITRRAISSIGEFPISWLEGTRLSDDQYMKACDAAEEIHSLNIDLRDSEDSFTLSHARASIAKTKRKFGTVDLVIIDYIQLMEDENPSRGSNRASDLKKISNGLKNLAKKFQVPIVALGQVKREVENRDDKRPRMGDVSDSSGIEAAADVIMMLYRDSYYTAQDTGNPEPDISEAELIIRKNRHGKTGTIYLAFQGAYVRFKEVKQAA